MNVRDVLQSQMSELQGEIELLTAEVARLETLHAEAPQLEAVLAQAHQLGAQIQEREQTTGALGDVSNGLLVKFGIVSPVEPPIIHKQPVKVSAIAPKPASVVTPASVVAPAPGVAPTSVSAKKTGNGDGRAGASQPTPGGPRVRESRLTYEDIFADSPAPAPVLTPVSAPAPRVNDQPQAAVTSVAQQSVDQPGAATSKPADEPEEDVWAALVDEDEESDDILAVTDPFVA